MGAAEAWVGHGHDLKTFAMVDVHRNFVAAGNPRDLYEHDGLHLSAEGYKMWSTWTHKALDVTIEESDGNFTGGDRCVGGHRPRRVIPQDWVCERVRPNVVNGWNELRGSFFRSSHLRKDAALCAILVALCAAALDRAIGVSSFS